MLQYKVNVPNLIYKVDDLSVADLGALPWEILDPPLAISKEVQASGAKHAGGHRLDILTNQCENTVFSWFL